MIKKHIPVIAGVVELLVRVVGSAVPNLELRSVSIHAVLDVKTLGVAEELDRAAVECPLLRVGRGAGLNGDGRTIRVTGSSQALAPVEARLKQNRGEVIGCLRADGSDEEGGEYELEGDHSVRDPVRTEI